MSQEITFAELDEAGIEMLPERAALGGFGSKWVSVYASNSALALNAGSHKSHANAMAYQAIFIG